MTTDVIKDQQAFRANGGRDVFGVAASILARDVDVLMGELAQFRQEKQDVNAKLQQAYARIEEQEQRIALLEAAATTDELTNLTNRRGFYAAFLGEVDRCTRGLVPGGLLVLIDLDNFKSINDTFGHAAGDAALRLVARTLQAQVRAMDVAARLGGDEFVLLFASTTKSLATARAQKLAWELNHLTLHWQGQEIPVRASLGLKEFGKDDKPEHIFNAADIALYTQKRARHSALGSEVGDAAE